MRSPFHLRKENVPADSTYARFARQSGVEIRLGCEVTPEYVEKRGTGCPDHRCWLQTTGFRRSLGIKGENVIIVNELYKNQDRVADKVAVMGGGLAGCECAIHLGMEGKKKYT